VVELIEVGSRAMQTFINTLVHPHTHVKISPWPDQSLKHGSLLQSGGTLWVEQFRTSFIALTFNSLSALIRLELPHSRQINIPHIVPLDSVHSLYISNISSRCIIYPGTLINLRLLVLDFWSDNKSEANRIGSTLTFDLAQQCPNLKQIGIVIKCTIRSSNFGSKRHQSHSRPTSHWENEVDEEEFENRASIRFNEKDEMGNNAGVHLEELLSADDALDRVERWQSLQSSVTPLERWEPVSPLLMEDWADYGDTNVIPSEESVEKFLDFWLDIYGTKFSSLIIQDEFKPQRWQTLLPILSAKVHQLELSAPSLAVDPPSFPDLMSFIRTRCKDCKNMEIPLRPEVH
jgi:hypothetical protein